MRWTIASCCALAVLMCCIALAQPGSGSSGGTSIAASSQPVSASVPPLIRFSGILGDLRSSTQTAVFSLYESPQSGVPLWSETQQIDVDDQGNYTVMLGSTRSEGMPLELFTSGRTLWLDVQIAGEPEQPRTLMVAVPYAFKAADAQTLGGLPASAFLLAPQPGAAPGGQNSSTPGSDSSTVVASSTASSASQSGNGGAGATKPTHSVTPFTACSSLMSDGTGTANQLVKFSAPCNTTRSAVFESGGKVGIGTTTPGATLDVVGGTVVRGTLQMPPKGTATAATGFYSQPEDWQASVFSSSTHAALTQHLLWQAEPVGNDTAAASARLSLLAAPGAALPVETGLSISSKGLITFASGQTFPGTGAGTITAVTAGTDLSGGGTSGNVTLKLNTALTDARYARLAAPNSFTGNQSVTGNLSASGNLTGRQLISTVATGTAPLSVASTTLVPNLNASLLGGFGAAAFARLAAANSFTANQSITGNLSATGQLKSTVATGTAPLSVTSTTLVPNLNASLLGSLPASAFAKVGANSFTGNQSITGSLTATVTSGTAITGNGPQGLLGQGANTAVASGTGGQGAEGNGGNATGSGGVGGVGLTGYGGAGTSGGGDGIDATGGQGINGTGNGVGLSAFGGANAFVSTIPGGDAVHAFGGQGYNSSGGIGVLVYGGGASGSAIVGGVGVMAAGGTAPTGGTGIQAAGGQSTDGTSNGVGLIASGGANLAISTSAGADAIQATGGDGNSAKGGNGITSTGGAGSGVGFGTNGGLGVNAFGGPAELVVGGQGGPGVDGTGGDAFTAGNGLQGFGGSAAAASGGTGGQGAGVQGGDADEVAGTGGDGIVAMGGLGAVPGYAGDFEGDVMVTGTLTAAKLVATTTKDFKIEDPIDPTKYLFHATVESSEMINIYSGVAVINHNGEAVVTLPKWFEALNGDFRYQLTCIGAWAPLYIAKEIAQNQFVIGGVRRE